MRVGHNSLIMLCLATAAITTGCDSLLEQVPDVSLEISKPAVSPEILLEEVREKQAMIQETGELHDKAGGAFRLRMIRMHAQTGLDLADQVLNHPDATDDHRSQARKVKLQLLSQAIVREFTDFDVQIDEFAAQVKTDLPQSVEAELADIMLLERSIRRGATLDEMLSALDEHARTFPDGKRAISVFQRFAEHLINQNQLPQAKRCCEVGLEVYSQHPESTSLQLLLSNMRKYLAAEQGKRVAKKSRLANITRQLGNREHGYFLIYAHENKSFGMIEVEYHVAHGAEAVADYIESLRPEWIWKLERWFPDTQQGELKAEQELDERLKGTITKFF